MSVPDTKYDLKGNKLTISLMLTVPIDIEVELLGIQPTSKQVKDEQFVNKIEELPQVINYLPQAELDEQIRVLSNQIVTEILHSDEIFYSIDKNKIKSDNLENEQAKLSDVNILSNKKEVVLQEVKQTEKKKRHLIDSLNDSLTLGVNAVGTIFFLGKLANYSWE